MLITFDDVVRTTMKKWNNPFMHLLDSTKEELEQELAYGSLQFLKEYECKKAPIPPREWDEMKAYAAKPEFAQLKQEAKDRFYRRFFAKPAVAEYQETIQRLFTENVSNFKWLNQILGWIPEGDTVNRGKVKDAIETYYGYDWSPYKTKNVF